MAESALYRFLFLQDVLSLKARSYDAGFHKMISQERVARLSIRAIFFSYEHPHALDGLVYC